VLGHILIKFLITDLKKSIKIMLMSFTYLNRKVPYSPNNTEKFGTWGRKISCLRLRKFLENMAAFLKKSSEEMKYELSWGFFWFFFVFMRNGRQF